MKKIQGKDMDLLARAVWTCGKNVICLMGDLGAGKTTFTQKLCEYMGVKEDVVSPTFSIVNVYTVSGKEVYHLDLYRIDEVSELDEIGFDEIVHSGSPVIVEWADRYAHLFPDDALWIKFAMEEDGSRYALVPEELQMDGWKEVSD